MNADMSVTKRQQISAQQRMRRLKNKIFLSAYRKGDEMTPEEEEKGRRLQLARVKKNEMQRERYRRTAEEERKLKNVILERFAEEERKLKNVCLTVQQYQLYDTQYSLCPPTMNAQCPKRRMNAQSALLNKYYEPKGGMNAQQRQKHDRIRQDAALLNKYSNGAALMDKEKKRIP